MFCAQLRADAKHDLLSASRRAHPTLLEPLSGPLSVPLKLGPTTVPPLTPPSAPPPEPPPQAHERLLEPAWPLQPTRPSELQTTGDRPPATAAATSAFDDATTAAAADLPRERVAPWHPWWPCLTGQRCEHGKMSHVSLEAEDELSQLVVRLYPQPSHERRGSAPPGVDTFALPLIPVQTAPREWAEQELAREALESSVLEASLAYLRTGGTGM